MSFIPNDFSVQAVTCYPTKALAFSLCWGTECGRTACHWKQFRQRGLTSGQTGSPVTQGLEEQGKK